MRKMRFFPFEKVAQFEGFLKKTKKNISYFSISSTNNCSYGSPPKRGN